MTPEQAKTALIFIERASLNATEINAYVEIHSALEEIANGEPNKEHLEA